MDERQLVPVVRIVTRNEYSGADIYVGSQLAGHRPYDGSGPDEIADEVNGALAALLREKLSLTQPEADRG